MLVWLLLGYILFSLLFGLLVGSGIRMQGADSSCDRPRRATAPRPAEVAARTGEPAGLGPRVAEGR